MKTWFVYLINGKWVETWANDTKKAEENLVKEYDNVEMEYVGNSCYDPKIKIDKVTNIGMNTVDKMITYGLVGSLVGLRWERG